MRNRCDVPHCTNARKAAHRLCSRCFDRLPPAIRLGLTAAKRERRESDWRALCREAGNFLRLPEPGAVEVDVRRIGGVSGEQAYQMTARILGERD